MVMDTENMGTALWRELIAEQVHKLIEVADTRD